MFFFILAVYVFYINPLLDTWNEDEINKRADYLISKAYEIWKYPEVSQETIDKYLGNESEETTNLDDF